jgi:ABC-type uncharacterized transport system substrate-binding protein
MLLSVSGKKLKKLPVHIMMLLFRFVLPIVLFFYTITCIYSHPHVFIDASVVINIEGKKLKDMEVIWIFDDFFSESIIYDFDINNDNRIDSGESSMIEIGAFSNLENYHYFTTICINGRDCPIAGIYDFTADIVNDSRLRYRFKIPLDLLAGEQEQVLIVGLYDETYYVDVQYLETGYALINGDGSVDYRYYLEENRAKAYWGGMVIPKEIHFIFWTG